jgi:hypothetical protein
MSVTARSSHTDSFSIKLHKKLERTKITLKMLFAFPFHSRPSIKSQKYFLGSSNFFGFFIAVPTKIAAGRRAKYVKHEIIRVIIIIIIFCCSVKPILIILEKKVGSFC